MNDRPRAETGLLVFHLAGHDYAVPLNRVQELVHIARLSRPPGLPSIVAGFLNLGGTAVSVLRLDRLFGLGDREPNLYWAVLVLRTGAVALLVDAVQEIAATSREAWLPVSAEYSFNGCAEAEVEVGGRIVHLLSPERILLEQERQTVKEFQELEQQRLRSLDATP